MLKSKHELAEKIFDNLLNKDLIDTVNRDYNDARLDAIDIIMQSMRDCRVINTDPIPDYTDEELIV